MDAASAPQPHTSFNKSGHQPEKTVPETHERKKSCKEERKKADLRTYFIDKKYKSLY
jgi:hypothetical protein